jgi:hypothetical protein
MANPCWSLRVWNAASSKMSHLSKTTHWGDYVGGFIANYLHNQVVNSLGRCWQLQNYNAMTCNEVKIGLHHDLIENFYQSPHAVSFASLSEDASASTLSLSIVDALIVYEGLHINCRQFFCHSMWIRELERNYSLTCERNEVESKLKIRNIC